MKKLMKSQETLTVQAGTNASCSCYAYCQGTSANYYNDVQRRTAFTGTTPMSVSEKE